jgi:CheY-like chemotaxis protein
VLKRWLPVLVVDDSLTMCAIMQDILCNLGFKDVQMRRNAIDAFTELMRREYGFVLCDVEMAPFSGIDLVKMMQRDKYLRDLPVILTTANAAHVAELFRGGASFPAAGFILKPFRANDLREKLSEVLESAYQKKDLSVEFLARMNAFEAGDI